MIKAALATVLLFGSAVCTDAQTGVAPDKLCNSQGATLLLAQQSNQPATQPQGSNPSAPQSQGSNPSAPQQKQKRHIPTPYQPQISG
jgi:hypothetical protein